MKIQLPAWQLVPAQVMIELNARGKTLRVAISGKDDVWVGVAIETDTSAAVEHVLDHHAHAVIGKHRSPATAKRAAERYARRWLRERLAGKTAQVDAKPCTCDEIVR